MGRLWLISVIATFMALLCCLRTQEVRSRQPYYRGEKVLRLGNFSEARKHVRKKDLDLLELWESMLTGRAAPLSRLMKEQYKTLGLNHIFTPSGFHLSAVLFPFLQLVKRARGQLLLLTLLGALAAFLPGFGALKRMILIKACQRLFDLRAGFLLALGIDVLVGSFQTSALSFSYSLLFLGIIYSGFSGLRLVIWFFIAQLLLAYFQGPEVSPLLLLFSPILNLFFSAAMPLLLLLAVPLTPWQLETGLAILKPLQSIVSWFAHLTSLTPTIEVHSFTLILTGLVIFAKWRTVIPLLLFFSGSLNPCLSREPGAPAKEFVPRGAVESVDYRESEVRIRFSDGRCRLRLVRGLWYENCSPRRRSSRKIT
jgi:hypothetical protein